VNFKHLATLLFVGFLSLVGAGSAFAGNAIVAGDLYIEPPTLINLGFEWRIDGDEFRSLPPIG